MRAAPQHEVGRPLWSALAAAGAPATIDQLAASAGAPRNSVQHRLWLWRRAGLVIRIQGSPARYAMSDIHPSEAAPSVSRDARIVLRKRPARARLWSAMRVLQTFDLPQLALSCGGISRSLASFLRDLGLAGYFAELRPADPATGRPAVYRLVRNTGPRAPTIAHRDMGGRFARCVVDRNTGDLHELPSRRAPGSDPFAGRDGRGVC